MPIHLPQRVVENVAGDFYVQDGCCTRCCLVHSEAPDLMNDAEQPFEQCYFRRQPQTPEELERAINAVCSSEMGALRYGGTDQSIIQKLRERQAAAQCDQAPEALPWLSRAAAAARGPAAGVVAAALRRRVSVSV